MTKEEQIYVSNHFGFDISKLSERQQEILKGVYSYVVVGCTEEDLEKQMIKACKVKNS